MSEVHFQLYFSPVLCANDRPPKTFLASHSNPLVRAVIHHHAWLTRQLKSTSKYQAPVSSCSHSHSVRRPRTDTHRRYFSTRQGDLVTSPVPGGVGLRVPAATSRLELPPDLLKYGKAGTNHCLGGKMYDSYSFFSFDLGLKQCALWAHCLRYKSVCTMCRNSY